MELETSFTLYIIDNYLYSWNQILPFLMSLAKIIKQHLSCFIVHFSLAREKSNQIKNT